MQKKHKKKKREKKSTSNADEKELQYYYERSHKYNKANNSLRLEHDITKSYRNHSTS